MGRSTVKRRYSDFRCLWESLRRRYPHRAGQAGIAAFPGRQPLLQSFSVIGPHFLQARLVGLTDFLAFLQRNADVMICHDVSVFLGVRAALVPGLHRQGCSAADSTPSRRSHLVTSCAVTCACVRGTDKVPTACVVIENCAKCILASVSMSARSCGAVSAMSLCCCYWVTDRTRRPYACACMPTRVSFHVWCRASPISLCTCSCAACSSTRSRRSSPARCSSARCTCSATRCRRTGRASPVGHASCLAPRPCSTPAVRPVAACRRSPPSRRHYQSPLARRPGSPLRTTAALLLAVAASQGRRLSLTCC